MNTTPTKYRPEWSASWRLIWRPVEEDQMMTRNEAQALMEKGKNFNTPLSPAQYQEARAILAQAPTVHAAAPESKEEGLPLPKMEFSGEAQEQAEQKQDRSCPKPMQIGGASPPGSMIWRS